MTLVKVLGRARDYNVGGDFDTRTLTFCLALMLMAGALAPVVAREKTPEQVMEPCSTISSIKCR